jgi:hypothetical protein
MKKFLFYTAIILIIFCSDAYSYQKTSDLNNVDTLNIVSNQISKIDSVDGKIYSVNVQYPEFSGYKNKNALKKLNMLINSIKDSIVNAFIENVRNDIRINQKSGNSELNFIFSVKYNRNGIVSFKYDVYPGFAGFAENYAYYSAINYNLKTGTQLKLKDLFKKGTDYLKILYEYSIGDMHNQALIHNKVPQEKRPPTFLGGIDDDWILDFSKESWLQPIEENYKFFVLTEKGIEFNYVSSLIQGFYPGKPDKVLVPYSQLKDIIDPKSPVVFETKK